MRDWHVLDAEADCREWTRLLRGHDESDVYFAPEYCAAFAGIEGADAKLFVYQEDGERSLFPFLLRPIPDSDRYDVTGVYGYGGFLVPADGVSRRPAYADNLVAALDAFYGDIGVVAEFVRYHPLLRTHDTAPIETESVRRTVAVDVGGEMDDAWRRYSSSNRRAVRKAIDAGLEFSIGPAQDRMDEFLPLYYATMERVGARQYYFFPESVLRRQASAEDGEAFVVTAAKNGELAAAVLLLGWGTFLHYHLGGSSADHLDLRPNNFLFHRVVGWAHARDYTWFHLGGGYAGEDSLLRFKAGFNRNGYREFHVSRRVIDRSAYDRLVAAWRERLPAGAEYANEYFPAYRAPVQEGI